jgi:hypothetical protein
MTSNVGNIQSLHVSVHGVPAQEPMLLGDSVAIAPAPEGNISNLPAQQNDDV